MHNEEGSESPNGFLGYLPGLTVWKQPSSF